MIGASTGPLGPGWHCFFRWRYNTEAMKDSNPESDTPRSEKEKIEDMESSLDRLQSGLENLREQVKEIKALIDAAKRSKRKQQDEDDSSHHPFSIAI